MIRTEGPRSLYNGLVAGLQRQMSFASVRIGLYDSVKAFYTGGAERRLREWYLFELCVELPLFGIIFPSFMFQMMRMKDGQELVVPFRWRYHELWISLSLCSE